MGGDELTTTFKLRVPGVAAPVVDATCEGMELLTRRELRGVDRGAGAWDEMEAQGDDVIELEWEDGLVEVMRVDDYARQRGADRGGSELVVATTRSIPGERAIAGLDGLNVSRWDDKSILDLLGEAAQDLEGKALDWLEKEGKKRLAKMAGEKALKLLDEMDVFGAVLRKLEDRTTLRNVTTRHRREGLYELDSSGVVGPLDEDLVLLGRVLVLVHGTFSHLDAAFDGLLRSAEWSELKERYDHVIGFQHYTVGRSPAENSRALAEALADYVDQSAKIDVVAHSRGGLVVEGVLPAAEPDVWKALLGNLGGRGDDRDLNPSDLSDLLEASKAAQKLGVRRFVRVGCPILGTSLMGDRLDTFATVIFTVAKLLGADVNPFYVAAKQVIRFLLKVRKDPWLVPGLAPMNPASRLLGVLNHPSRRTKAEVYEVGVATSGRGILQRVKVGAARVFFWGDNDLVVDTANMFGGSRAERRWVRRFSSSTVDHTSYFSDDDSRRAILRSLRGDPQGFSRMDDVLDRVPRDRGAAVAMARGLEEPPLRGGRARLVLVPGIMGSRLEKVVNGQRYPIWFDYGAIVRGGFLELELDRDNAPEIEATSPIAEPYQAFVEHMDQSFDVRLFAYDWRHSVMESGQQLAERLRGELEANQPVHVVAHSMGGLVLRAALAQDAGLEAMIQARGGRFIMAGTPNRGSYEMLHLVARERDSVLNVVAALDLPNRRNALAEVARGFHGVLEMLPWRGHEVWKPGGRAWQEAGEPAAGAIKGARKVQKDLEESYPKSLIYVAGTAKETLARLDPQGDYGTTDRGDGRVTHESGIPSAGDGREVMVYYLNAVHGNLLNHGRDSFEAYRELLVEGTTGRLSVEPIEPTVGAAVRRWMRRSRAMPRRPTGADALEALLCQGTEAVEKPPATPIRVAVEAGSLQWARHPLLVGHYEGDEIVGAERLLDIQLEHELSLRRDLGTYAGPLGTHTVHLRPNGCPPGALVVGLGHPGALSEARLREVVAQAALAYVVEHRSQNGPTPRLGLSSLSVGARGPLSVSASVRAILRGVQDANRILRARGLEERIDELEFIEIYQTRARQALRELHRWKDQGGDGQLILPEVVHCGPVSRPSPHPFEPWNEWARRILIKGPKDGRDATFSVLTERARAEATTADANWETIKAVVAQAMTSSSRADHYLRGTSLGWLLYRLLVPDEVSSVLRDGKPVQLIVDEHTAAIPWELLEDTADGARTPLVTRLEMTRQLLDKSRGPAIDAKGRRVVIMADLEHADEERRLEEAYREAEDLADLLRNHHYDVPRELIRPQGLDIVNVLAELFREPIQILHVAAHGDLGKGDDPRPAVLMSGEMRLDATILGRLSHAPAMVFLNCCHLGDMSGPVFASSIARELIGIGVRVVVAAGWRVDDRAARTFAGTFYRQLLDGAPLRSAAKEARRETYKRHPASNSWGAFQIYGDPGFVFESAQAHGRTEITEKPLTESEVVGRLEVLSSRLLMGGSSETIASDVDAQLRQWEELVGDGSGRENGDMLQRFGELYLMVMKPDQALELFERAGEDPKRRARMSLDEKVVDAHTRKFRLARRLGRSLLKSEVVGADAARKRLMNGKETSERHALLGASFKDQAAVASDGVERIALLNKSFESYEASFRTAKDSRKAYPMTVMTALRRVALASGKSVKETPRTLASSLGWMRNNSPLTDRDFWSINTHADSYMLSLVDYHLRPGKYRSVPHATLGCVKDWYEFSFTSLRTPWHWHSAVEMIRWLHEMIALAVGPQHRAMVDGLAPLLSHLEGLERGTVKPKRDRPRSLDERTDWLEERLSESKAGTARTELLELFASPGERPMRAELARGFLDHNPFAG